MSSRRLVQDQYFRPWHTSSTRLQDFLQKRKNVFKTSSRRLKDVLKMSYEDVLRHLSKTSFRRLKDVGFANLEDILHGYLKDISYSGK